MEHSTACTLHTMAVHINRYGLHTGDQFAAPGPSAPMDICALAYIVAERCGPPAEFFADEAASLRLIECSAPAMQAIRAISAALDTEPCVTDIAPGYEVPDYIEHVSNWAATRAPFADRPTVSEVIGRILRAAAALEPTPVIPQRPVGTTPGFTDDHGLCTTCGGHGAIQGDEIPYEELRPRQKQGYAHGRRYHRSRPCPHCDGYDHITPMHEPDVA